jgi:uncharacterized protein (DUF58 family)
MPATTAARDRTVGTVAAFFAGSSSHDATNRTASRRIVLHRGSHDIQGCRLTFSSARALFRRPGYLASRETRQLLPDRPRGRGAFVERNERMSLATGHSRAVAMTKP